MAKDKAGGDAKARAPRPIQDALVKRQAARQDFAGED